jgi:hypothetical protein
VLQIFRSEIDAQIVVIKQSRANEFLKQQQRSQVGQEVAKWRDNVASLQKTITSGGSVAVNPSADPRIQALTKSRTDAQKQADTHYKEWQCQLYGGEGCTRKGNGPLARASKAAYDKDVARINGFNRQIEARRAQLTATDEASKEIRLQEAKDALPKANAQLDAAVQRQNDLQARFDAENKATNGLLIRLQALDEVSGHNFTLNGARFLLFLLFLLIECLPVAVKLMQRPGSYEKILRLATDEELRAARADFSGRRTGGRDGETRSLRDMSIRDIWLSRQPVREGFDLDQSSDTVTAPAPASAPRAYAGGGADQSDTGEHTSLDHVALRNMEDTRAARSPGSPADRNSGAIELYGDDDEF